MDLFFINDLDEQKFEGRHALMIDVFDKSDAHAVPIKGKQGGRCSK